MSREIRKSAPRARSVARSAPGAPQLTAPPEAKAPPPPAPKPAATPTRTAAGADPRTAPHNLDAEQGLLAACLLENGLDVLTDCLAAKLRAECFYRPAHQLIFGALVQLHSAGVPPEEIVLANKLQEMGQLDAVGGHAYLYEISGRIQTTVHAKHWLKIVRDKHFLRQLIRTAQWTAEQAHAGADNVPELLSTVESEFFKIQQDNISESAEPAARAVDTAMGLIANMLNRRGQVSGVPSGFSDLDKMTFGFHSSEMIVVAARPSMGKTAIALNMAEHAVLPAPRENRAPTPTLIFSLEMAAEQLALRMLCAHARADMQQLKNGFTTREAEQALTESAKLLKQAPLWIDASAALTISEMRAKARRLHARHKLGLVIIDYLQLVGAGRGFDSREQEVAEVSRGCKALAKELAVPVIVLCQLNRESERENRAPRLSDLRESGSIEQDADVVLLLAKARKPKEEGRGRDGDKDEAEDATLVTVERSLVVAKNRNGPVADISLIFNRRLTRFENHIRHAS